MPSGSKKMHIQQLDVDKFSIKGTALSTAVLLASGQAIDLNGETGGIVFDADANTKIYASADNVITIDIGGASDFEIAANTLTALSGSTIAADTIAETTADAGVTIDGLLVKDTAVYGRSAVVAVSSSGAITVPAYNVHYFITKGTAAAMTIVDPTATTHDGVTLTFIATTAAAHSLDNSAGSGFFSSGGASKDVATWGGAIGDGFTIMAYAGKWYIDPRGVTNVTLG